MYGLDFKQMFNGFRYTPMLIKHLIQFNLKNTNKEFKIKRMYPCLNDINSEGGSTQTHYFIKIYILQQKFSKIIR